MDTRAGCTLEMCTAVDTIIDDHPTLQSNEREWIRTAMPLEKVESADIDELSIKSNVDCNHLSWEHLHRALNAETQEVTDLVQIPIMPTLADYTVSLRQQMTTQKRWDEEQKNDVQLGTWN